MSKQNHLEQNSDQTPAPHNKLHLLLAVYGKITKFLSGTKEILEPVFFSIYTILYSTSQSLPFSRLNSFLIQVQSFASLWVWPEIVYFSWNNLSPSAACQILFIFNTSEMKAGSALTAFDIFSNLSFQDAHNTISALPLRDRSIFILSFSCSWLFFSHFKMESCMGLLCLIFFFNLEYKQEALRVDKVKAEGSCKSPRRCSAFRSVLQSASGPADISQHWLTNHLRLCSRVPWSRHVIVGSRNLHKPRQWDKWLLKIWLT